MGIMKGRSPKFDEWLWSLDEERLAGLRLEDLPKESAGDGIDFPQITTATVISDLANPLSLIAQNGVGIDDSRETAWGGLLRASLGGKPYVVGLWSAGSGVFVFFGSVPATDSRWDRVEKSWINRSAPSLSRMLLNQDDFSDLGDVLSEHGEVSVSRMTARVVSDGSSYSRGWPGELVVERPNHRDALRELSTGSMVLRTITLSAGKRLAVHLRQQAGATFYWGDFPLFVNLVLGRFTSLAQERIGIIDGANREPRERITEVIRMSFELDRSLVRNALVEGLGTTPGVRAAVLHSDAYLHMIITDYLNGSNCDLIVTEANELRMIPGFKASPASMSRIADAVGESLGMLEFSSENLLELDDEAGLISS